MPGKERPSAAVSVYRTVQPDDFAAMVEADRYGQRTAAFDEIITLTEGHFWDPEDARYIDYGRPFDVDKEPMMPSSTFPELNCAVADRLDEHQRVVLINELTYFQLSQLLHGEQGGLSLSVSLCQIFHDPGAQEYAANQAREEARHVRALSKYIASRWGSPAAIGGGVLGLMSALVMSGEVYQKIIGMQMIIEGMALGAFAHYHSATTDPLLRRLVQLLMTDESYHHRFGRIWGKATLPDLNEEQKRKIENWAAGCFTAMFRNSSGWKAKRAIYEKFGLDWKWVADAIKEASSHPASRGTLQYDMYRVTCRTLLQAGIITDRTRPIYQGWLDPDDDHAEPGPPGGQELADGTIRELREIHRQIRRA